MSSPTGPESESTPEGQHPPEQESPDEGGPGEETGTPSEASVDTVECPNCGRVFTGTYCPDCGQEANRELSTVEVFGDFFRELVDTERGFWHTFKGLMLRPGTTVRRYLEGEHRPFMSPGRYLLVSAVIGGVLTQILQWIVPSTPRQALMVGIATGFATGFIGGTQEQEALPSESAVAEAAHRAEHLGSLRILTLVALAGLAGLLYRSLFRRHVGSLGESYALAAYAVGHAVILMSGARFVLGMIHQYWIDVSMLSAFAFLALLLFYPGTVTYGCFGASWWNGLKGTLGTLWALVEMAFVSLVGIGGYAGWLLWAHPETYSGREPVVTALVGGGIILLLLHGPAFFLRGGNSLR
jgi:uncharacterized membrane protein